MSDKTPPPSEWPVWRIIYKRGSEMALPKLYCSYRAPDAKSARAAFWESFDTSCVIEDVRNLGVPPTDDMEHDPTEPDPDAPTFSSPRPPSGGSGGSFREPKVQNVDGDMRIAGRIVQGMSEEVLRLSALNAAISTKPYATESMDLVIARAEVILKWIRPEEQDDLAKILGVHLL